MQIQLAAFTNSTSILQKFLQYIQDFNVAHSSEVQFSILVDTPELTTEEVTKILDSITPRTQIQIASGEKN